MNREQILEKMLEINERITQRQAQIIELSADLSNPFHHYRMFPNLKDKAQRRLKLSQIMIHRLEEHFQSLKDWLCTDAILLAKYDSAL